MSQVTPITKCNNSKTWVLRKVLVTRQSVLTKSKILKTRSNLTSFKSEVPKNCSKIWDCRSLPLTIWVSEYLRCLSEYSFLEPRQTTYRSKCKCRFIIFLDQTPTFDHCVVQWGSTQKIPLRHMMYKENRLDDIFKFYWLLCHTLDSGHNWEDMCSIQTQESTNMQFQWP